MYLTIRWKFILSIGVTLIVTYLGLLTWDYWWQRETATQQMQQQVADRARIIANTLNEQLAADELQAEAVATELERQSPVSEAQFHTIINQLQQRSVRMIVSFDPQFAKSAGLQQAYLLPTGLGGRGGRGGRGGAGGGAGARGGGFPDRSEVFPGGGGFPERGGGLGPDRGAGSLDRDRGAGPDRAGATGERGFGTGAQRGASGQRGGGGAPFRDFGATTLPSFDQEAEPAYTRVAQVRRALWIEPHVIRGLPGAGPQTVCAYSVPILKGDTLIGVVAAVVPVPSIMQNLMPFSGPDADDRGGAGRGFAPTSAPTTQLSMFSAMRQPTIVGNEGRVILPLAPADAKRTSILTWAKENGMPNLAEDLRTTLDGENATVWFYYLHDVPDLIPGAAAGECYWVAFAPVAATDWLVASAISEPQSLGPTIAHLWQRVIFLGGGLVVLLLVTAFVSIRVSRPIERMARAVNELAGGDLDAHVTGVSAHDELGQLAGAFNTMTTQLKAHVAALTEQTAARETVEAELRIARQIQNDLLPKTFPPFPNRKEFDLHAINVPAHRVAGDFYDFFFTPNDLLTIVIADVSGKGVPAALLMAVTRTIVRNLAMEGLSPKQIAERANAMLLQDLSDSMFVTMFLCQYNTRTGKIVYVNAGHPPPYRIAPNTDATPFGDVTGALLGVNVASPSWPYEQHEDQLEVGQMLLLYTDGVTEARAPDGTMLRNSGVEKLIAKYHDENVKGICTHFVEELNHFQAGQPADDITLVALRRRA